VSFDTIYWYTSSCRSLFPKNTLSTVSLNPGVLRTTNLEGKTQFVKNVVPLRGKEPCWTTHLQGCPRKYTVHPAVLLIAVRASGEICYWQSAYTAEMFCIPRSKFALLCHEIQQDVGLHAHAGVPGSFNGDFRWERDALMALQLMTEHLLVKFFEMTHFFSFP